MNNRYQQILFLYFKNPGFMILSAIFLLAALLSKTFYHMGYGYYAEEIFTIFFIAALWLTFHLGIILKRQFSSHRASLLPRYRIPHINCAFSFYLIFILAIYIWEFGLRPVFNISATGLWGIYGTCLFIGMVITYLGYLSIGRLIIYAYVILLVFSNRSFDILLILNNSNYSPYLLGVACLLFTVFFRNRLLCVKEGSFEYGHIFSWPSRSFILGQMKANQCFADLLGPLTNFLRSKNEVLFVSKYPRKGNICLRAYHWNCMEHADFKAIWIIMLLLAPLFLLFLNNQSVLQNFNKDVYSNFLLLVMSPVVVTMGSNYKRIAYWGYDLLKPVNRGQYFKEQAVIFTTHLFLYWILFAICFAVLPSIILQPQICVTKKFWGYLFLTADMSFIVLCWLAILNCILNPVAVIVSGAMLSLIVMFYFFYIPQFTFGQILFHSLVCFVMTAILLIKAYKAWCEKEFI